MKIAQISPIVERVPPKKYGGTERVVYTLTEELVRRGHDVTLFATEDSITSARLISTSKKGLRESAQSKFYERMLETLTHVGMAYSMQDEFDIIHDHSGAETLPMATLAKTPVVRTVHSAFNEKNVKIYQELNNSFNPYFVSISNSQREPLPDINYISTVYNGLSMNNYPFSSIQEGYLLFVGRIAIEKGVHNAIKVAQRLKLPLIIAAKLEEINIPYFREYIKPHLSDSIQWIGEVSEEERNRLMSRALCFLHPVTFREPFGLTLIESMATGCPVIAFNKGSIPEIIQEGRTGFIVDTETEMIAAVKQINTINRNYCRQYALTNFSAERMTDNYERVYQRILFAGIKKQLIKRRTPERSLSF